jgi:hypothetical protein
MKIAIVALTRGYPDNLSKYSDLINRNISIYEKINQYRKVPADILLFHEGNISQSDQEYIKFNSPEPIKFIDVSKYFVKIDLKFEDSKRFNLGYRYMCRFNMFYIWHEVKNYDYILRVDEDIQINKFDPFIFEVMEKNNLVFFTGRFSKEDYEPTNKTLPKFLIKNMLINSIKLYNHKFPYTNVYATKVKFWLEKDVQNILKIVAESDEQIIFRWGDLPVLGTVLNYKNTKIHLFKISSYKHISHSLLIKNNLLRNYFINNSLNPISKNNTLVKYLKNNQIFNREV